MLETAYVTFFLKEERFAIRNTYFVPRVDDEVRLFNKAYKIKFIIWCYDEPEYKNKVNIGIEPVKGE